MPQVFIQLLPNFLTGVRVLLSIYSLYFYYNSFYGLFLVFLCLALLTDFFDGFIARYFNVSSDFGAIFDPACDKLVIVLMVSFFYIEGVLGKFFCFFLMLRPFVQMMSFLCVSFCGLKFYIRPSLYSKILNALIFGLIFTLSLGLYFRKQSIGEQFHGLVFLLYLVVIFEISFMIYYPFQFFKILKKDKIGFD